MWRAPVLVGLLQAGGFCTILTTQSCGEEAKSLLALLTGVREAGGQGQTQSVVLAREQEQLFSQTPPASPINTVTWTVPLMQRRWKATCSLHAAALHISSQERELLLPHHSQRALGKSFTHPTASLLEPWFSLHAKKLSFEVRLVCRLK